MQAILDESSLDPDASVTKLEGPLAASAAVFFRLV